MKEIKITPLLLFANLIVSIVVGYFVVSSYIRIIHNQTQTLGNQYNNSKALEDFQRNGYICIFTAPPKVATSGNPGIINYLNNCLKDTPEIK